MTRISTTRLILDPVTGSNAVVLWRIMQSGHLREFQDVPRHSREEFDRRVSARPKRLDGRTPGRFEWLIVLADTRRAIGWISLRVAERTAGSAELGYSLVAGYRGSGYAGEAVAGLLGDVFETTGIIHVEACTLPANVASRNLLRRAGFNETRVQSNGAMVRGRPVDIVCYELLRERWAERTTYGASANSIVIPASANPK